MITGIKKTHKTTEIYFDEADNWTTVITYGEERNSIDDFIVNANRFIDIQELTPEIVHAFISKIYVYEKKEKWSRTEGNDIDIVFTVGFREQHTVRTSDALAS